MVTGKRSLNILQRYNIVAWLDRCDALTNGLDNASAFVAKNYGECSLGILTGQSVGI